MITDNILDDLKTSDRHINDALDEIGIPRDDGLAIYSTWGRVSLLIDRLAKAEAAQPAAERTTPGGSDCPHGYAKRFDCPDCNPRTR